MEGEKNRTLLLMLAMQLVYILRVALHEAHFKRRATAVLSWRVCSTTVVGLGVKRRI